VDITDCMQDTISCIFNEDIIIRDWKIKFKSPNYLDRFLFFYIQRDNRFLVIYRWGNRCHGSHWVPLWHLPGLWGNMRHEQNYCIHCSQSHDQTSNKLKMKPVLINKHN
jgi:hypothetical protein